MSTRPATSVTSNVNIVNSKEAFNKCPHCGNQFDVYQRACSGKVPLILNCKHTVCEGCIRRMCSTNVTSCPVCQEEFTVPKAQMDNLTELFQPHYSLIGQLVWARINLNKKQLGFMSKSQTLGSRHEGDGDMPKAPFDVGNDESDVDEFSENSCSSLTFNKCSIHNEHYCNISCGNCNETYCCYCFVEDHIDHKATYLYKLEDKEQAELEKLKNDAQLVQNQLLVSIKKAKDLRTTALSRADNEIRKYFSDLCAKLHTAEHNLRRQLRSKSESTNAVDRTLKSELQRVDRVLRHLELLDTKAVNMKALYEEVREIRSSPCCLVAYNREPTKPNKFVSSTVLGDTEDSVSLENFSSVQYSLRPVSDWKLTQELNVEKQDRMRGCKGELALTTLAAVVEKTEPKKTNEGKVRVIVTHINNLNSFFVQEYHTLGALKDMNDSIETRTKRSRNGKEYRVGGVYGVFYKTKNLSQWRRGKLLDIINRGSNDFDYKVYFLDYGNTQVVPKVRLKEVNIRTVKHPPFAFECKLTNPDDKKFDPNTHKLLFDTIRDKELYLLRVNKQDGVEEVDLLMATSSGGLISVRDLLSQTTIPIKNEIGFFATLKFFQNSKRFVVGQEEQVIVTEILDPFHIYVVLAHSTGVLKKMATEMKKHYVNKPSITCVPVEGADVVVYHRDECKGNWHRATVRSVDLSRREVDAFLVDWGLTTTVPWLNIKKLIENFIKVECQAIPVKLAHVEKLDQHDDWTSDAVNFLRLQLELDVECRMVVSEENPLEVALFQPQLKDDICLNSLLVEHKHALSTGHLSETILWPKTIIDRQREEKEEEEEEEDDMIVKMIKTSEETFMDDDDDVHMKSGLRLSVTVLNFESPDLIYVRFNRDKETEEILYKELQIHYSAARNNDGNVVWNEGEICVVYDSLRNCYCRAVVKKRTLPDDYVVYLFDHCRQLRVSKNHIFVMDRYFKAVRDLTFKCRLALVRPAGGAGTWTRLGIEILQRIFTKYRCIYVKELERDVESKVMSVVMWYCLTTPAKALERSRQMFISINKTLVRCGVALNAPIATGASPFRTEFNDRESPEENHEQEEKNQHQDAELECTNQKAWLPSFAIRKRDFGGVLTCVDNRGFLWVREEEMQAIYLEMEERINKKASLKEARPDSEWSVGDMCSIFYEERWYRGTVLNILEGDEVCVEMIDFGSEHFVPKAHLSKSIIYPDFPPLVYTVQLYDVHCVSGQWTSDDIRDLLDIVTDKVKVVIKGDINEENPFAEIYLDSGLSLNDLITTKSSRMVRRESKVVLRMIDFDEGSDTRMSKQLVDDYSYVPLPEAINGLCEVFVIDVIRWDTSYSVIVSSVDSSYNSDEIASLSGDIEMHISEQPLLEDDDIVKNKPCVCFDTKRNKWGRAKVYSTESKEYGDILVFFVDYGNIEVIPVSNIKVMRYEWFRLPVYTHIAAVSVELLQSNQAEYFLMQLKQSNGKFISVKIVAESPLTVSLYDGEDLCYQKFVNCGIIKTLE